MNFDYATRNGKWKMQQGNAITTAASVRPVSMVYYHPGNLMGF